MSDRKLNEFKKDHRLEEILMYEDGALTDAERAELEAHMGGCVECQATLEEVRRFLPALQKALVPDEPSAEELLAWAKAQMREKERGREAQPAGFVTRMRVAVAGFGLATAAAIAIALQTLLTPAAGPVMADVEPDAGVGDQPGLLAAPLPPEVFAKLQSDAGLDAGIDRWKWKGGERQ